MCSAKSLSKRRKDKIEIKETCVLLIIKIVNLLIIFVIHTATCSSCLWCCILRDHSIRIYLQNIDLHQHSLHLFLLKKLMWEVWDTRSCGNSMQSHCTDDSILKTHFADWIHININRWGETQYKILHRLYIITTVTLNKMNYCLSPLCHCYSNRETYMYFHCFEECKLISRFCSYRKGSQS